MALVSLLLTASDIAAGTLVQPFGPQLPAYRYYLVYPPSAAKADAEC